MGSGRKKGDGEKSHAPETWARAWENRGLVFHVAQTYYPHARDHDEYLIDGLKGLCLAIERFNSAKGKLSSFAVLPIKNLIGRAIAEQQAIFHVPAHVSESADFRPPGVRREDEDWSLDFLSIDDDCEEDPGAIHAAEMIEDALSRLKPRQAEVVRRRFGIGPGYFEQEPPDIAEEMGVRREIVNHDISRGLKRIRKHIERKREGATA